ncbi:MAG: PepSY domain-containing protein [Novosphingobium sp.]|nr:PepSY domain-containing protein [Novosphingobium sp.]
MKQPTLKAWCFVHKWSSIVSTAFLLFLCLTGLPLIFHDEIDALTRPAVPLAAVPSAAAPVGKQLTIDQIIALALKQHPGDVPLYVSFDEDRPVVNVTTGPRPDAPESAMRFVSIDQRTGASVGAPGGGVMDVILDLHKDLMLGPWAMYFLGLIGLLFVVAIVSGVVIYSPFMQKLDFATVRRNRSTRTMWLDWHNLLGIVTMLWAVVVGFTGTMNAFADPITAWWRADALAMMIKGEGPAVLPYRLGSADPAVQAAIAAAPGMKPQFVAFPGVAYSSTGHLAVFLQGTMPATKKLLTPVLVNARTGKVDAVMPMPWYMKALMLSQPLHFGDYGGLAMKLIWALFDLATIVVLGSGLYLWLGRPARARRSRQEAQA